MVSASILWHWTCSSGLQHLLLCQGLYVDRQGLSWTCKGTSMLMRKWTAWGIFIFICWMHSFFLTIAAAPLILSQQPQTHISVAEHCYVYCQAKRLVFTVLIGILQGLVLSETGEARLNRIASAIYRWKYPPPLAAGWQGLEWDSEQHSNEASGRHVKCCPGSNANVYKT